MNAMREIYALELSLLVKELKAFEGFYIDKFYELREGAFRIRASKKGEKADLICTIKSGMWRASEAPVQERPTPFVAAVRKRVSGYFIENIRQMNNDRILAIDLKKGDSRIIMLFEMVAKGNLLILDDSLKIGLVYKQGSFKERSMRIGDAYTLPKNKSVDYLSIGKSIKINEDGQAPIISALGKMVNMGPLYIEEALARLGISPKRRAEEISEGTLQDISGSIGEILKEAGAGNYIIYKKEGRNVDYSVCRIRKYEGLEKEEYRNMQQLLDKFYSTELFRPEAAIDEKAKELEESIKKQRKIMEGMDSRMAAEREAAEAIFKNMQLINNMITMLQQEKRLTKEELQKRFAGVKVLEVDLKKKSFIIEV
ncbi:NFACT family protein [Candidatus Marsarchaeota archaeon]|jgi:predicted ribosome quality control (RQC) complex YloA/Tae2 family protein|nr:NFACT family protein [Candidatus Marsarchaeota archaeon]